MNVWHSFQYLALTWMLNHLRQKRSELDRSRSSSASLSPDLPGVITC
jgi:hypothetical protein